MASRTREKENYRYVVEGVGVCVCVTGRDAAFNTGKQTTSPIVLQGYETSSLKH